MVAESLVDALKALWEWSLTVEDNNVNFGEVRELNVFWPEVGGRLSLVFPDHNGRATPAVVKAHSRRHDVAQDAHRSAAQTTAKPSGM
jgi:hypothetical protein